MFDILHRLIGLETLGFTLLRSELIDNVLELNDLRPLVLNLMFGSSAVDFNRLYEMLRRFSPMFVLIRIHKPIRCDRVLHERWMQTWESRRTDLLNLDRDNLVLYFDFE